MPFIRASWDSDGVLTIFAVLLRQYTLWCHARANEVDYYFSHQIKFFEAPTIQIVLGVYIQLQMPSPMLRYKCRLEQYTCDCRDMTYRNVTEHTGEGLSEHLIKEFVSDHAKQVCQDYGFCGALSLDEFLCTNNPTLLTSSHYVEMSFFLDGRVRRDPRSPDQLLTVRERSKRLFKELYRRVISKRWDLIRQFDRLLGGYVSKHKVKMYFRPYQYCMGLSGKLDTIEGECDLCPPGSYTSGWFISPGLPHSAEEQATEAGKRANTSTTSDWLENSAEKQCISCPFNTFNEQMGRMSCVPCPDWHMKPEVADQAKRVQMVGADWIHIACEKNGYEDAKFGQVVTVAFGDKVGDWYKKASQLDCIVLLSFLVALPVFLSVAACFYAYVVLDVGGFLVKVSNTMHLLQVQVAEMVISLSRWEAEEKKAINEAYIQMKLNPPEEEEEEEEKESKQKEEKKDGDEGQGEKDGEEDEDESSDEEEDKDSDEDDDAEEEDDDDEGEDSEEEDEDDEDRGAEEDENDGIQKAKEDEREEYEDQDIAERKRRGRGRHR
ncbi:unnamed protein product [Calicophoron daubneyi]|uniref:Tyrosine-protein kinase ephrin type A/B receptor-like domain-containing protein n=1 Tax=Calicophoron daubneyi TaxID=300641 RepID=A0AAV2THC2_CALDB